MQQVVIIDYGMGNLKSVAKAIETVGAKVVVSNRPEDILKGDKLILPGVGAFKDCIINLKKYNLIDAIKEFIQTGKFFLGICLGLHALFEKSYEFGEYKGLSLIEGEVLKFTDLGSLPVPHMGWNQIEIRKNTPFLNEIANGDFFYFAHSYYVSPKNPSDIMTTTDYGIQFTSSINRDNILGVQFHPEKSQKKGLKIFQNFIEL
jgi:glutamine amidotransferase